MSTTAGALTAALRSERQRGNISVDTETHLRHELRRLGWHSDDAHLVEPITLEIERLEHEAETLRKLREAMFGSGVKTEV